MDAQLPALRDAYLEAVRNLLGVTMTDFKAEAVAVAEAATRFENELSIRAAFESDDPEALAVADNEVSFAEASLETAVFALFDAVDSYEAAAPAVQAVAEAKTRFENEKAIERRADELS